MQRTKPTHFYWEPVALLTCTTLYAWAMFMLNRFVVSFDYPSLIFDGMLAVLPIAGMFLISGLHCTARSAYRLLLAGMAVLSISTATDTLDEEVEMTDLCNILFEGVFQVAGFALSLFGLHRWIEHNQAQNHQLSEQAAAERAATRQQFAAAFQAEVADAVRQLNRLSLIIFDIDNSRRIDSAPAHDTGARMLIDVSRIIRPLTRSSDVFSRHGSNQFVVLVPHTDLKGARHLADKLRLALEGYPPATPWKK